MKLDPTVGSPIWDAWNAGGARLGAAGKADSRVTVEPGWTLKTQTTAGTRPASKLPIRYFQRLDNGQVTKEVPGVRSVELDYDIDQDVATCTITLTNNVLDPDYSSTEWENSNGDFGRPGFLTPERGSTTNRWGFVPNEWSGLLTRDALVRVFQGYGSQGMSIPDALASGNLVQTGIFLLDDAPVSAGQVFKLQGRNMAKLLVDQDIFGHGPGSLIPTGDYPFARMRYRYQFVQNPIVVYGHLATNPLDIVTRIERDATGDGYWLLGADGAVFSFGLTAFYGSLESTGTSITPAAYPNIGATGFSRSKDGAGYLVCTDTGSVYAFGSAAYAGGLALGASPAHPVVAIEAAKPATAGYWLLQDDGTVSSFGGAASFGPVAIPGGHKAVDMAVTPDGTSLWLVDDAGDVYTLGSSAGYHGGNPISSHPIVAIEPTITGNGYYLAASDGGVFTFGDAAFFGSIPGASPPITLNDPVCDIALAPDGTGYWLVAQDGGVFTFEASGSQVQFLGSLPGGEKDTFTVDGNMRDYLDVVKDLLLYAGFHLYDGGVTDNVFGTLEQTGIYPSLPNGDAVLLDATFFDKLPVISPLTKIKEVVGYSLRVGPDGGAIFAEPNFWESGNFLPGHVHTSSVPVVDEKVQLTKYTRSVPDQDLRSEIIISTNNPEDGVPGAIWVTYAPSTASELKGLVRPAMWVNEAFDNASVQETMAALISLHIYFKTRLGSVTCLANPLIDVDDQIQILERETFENNTHYVRRIHSTHDRKTGSYTMDLTTNVLSPPGSWVVVKPPGAPAGAITSNLFT